jgi:hypothetical protein
MKALAIVTVLVAWFVLAASAALADCNWKKYDFTVDPHIQTCLEGTSVHYWFLLDEPVLVPDGGYISMRYILRGNNYDGLGQSSLAGPIGVGVTNCYPFVRLNWHYMTSIPQQSICTLCNGSEPRYNLTVGHEYCANLIHAGSTVRLELYSMPESVLVFTDVQPCDWVMFDRFHLCYDYYGGGYCVWDPANEEIDCRADRSTSYVEYSIKSITVCDVGPTSTDNSSWGSVKALYR